ncbi:hypothetical protein JW916_12030 [Candidatus Sumerlaeota bacterium]|nr:hypothetical protein [Candidatus Sumerlaeota bacterium]
MARWIVFIAGLLTLSVPSAAEKEPASPHAQPTALTIEVENDALYVLDRETLEEHGMPLDKIDPRTIGLFCEGKPVPIYIVGEADGTMDESDSIVFYGEYPRGKTTTRRIQNDRNHYFLRWDVAEPLRYRPAAPPVPENPTQYPNLTSYRHTEHMEKDWRFDRFYTPKSQETDYYFWVKTVPIPDAEPITIALPRNVFDPPPQAKDTFDLKVKFYGISQGNIHPHHKIQVIVGDTLVGEPAWEEIQEHTFEAKDLPADLLRESPEPTRVKFMFPEDRISSGVVDAILIDWIEVSYWHATDALNAPIFEFNTREQSLPIYKLLVSSLAAEEGDAMVFDRTRQEIFRPAEVRGPQGEIIRVMFPRPGPADYVMVGRLSAKYPEAIRPVYPEPAFTADNQADMIVVSHPEFLSEVEQLAEYRRSQGLSVLVVDLQSVFDRYNDGFFEDKPVRDYLRYAWKNYREPKPRYVLLVGDATFDYRHVVLKEDRNLLPIHWLSSTSWRSGGYPSDNWFSLLDDDSTTPSVALGRIPANAPGQVLNLLDKIKAYEKAAEDKPRWANRAVALTSIEKYFQNLIRQAAEGPLAGFKTEILFPTVDTVRDDVKKLQERIDAGCSLLYYLGHGGAFVWRVGPIDFKRQEDLFTPKHVKELENRGRYPLVLVTSCYSAAFDNYLSIGESLLMEPEKGAVAVVATGWKSLVENDHPFHMHMMEDLFVKKMERLGDAYLDAKHAQFRWESRTREIRDSFLILGDPALKVCHPE